MSTTVIDILSIPEDVVEQGVFETPDSNIPEFRPYRVLEDRDNADIDRSSISIADVTLLFKQKVGDVVPGSHQESKNFRKSLYRTYVTNSLTRYSQKSRKESPSQKLRRLIIETQELEAQIEEIGPESCKNPPQERTPVDIVNQLNSIQQKAAQLRLKLPGTQQVALTSEGDRLMSKLNGLFASEDLPQVPAALKPPPYQNQVAHALELEARVSSLEGLLGPETLIKADIPQEQGLASLLASMLKMVEKIKKPDHVFAINKRLKELISELDRLTSLRDTLKQLGRDQVLFSENAQVDSETKSKIDGLLGLYDKFEVYMALGPQIVTRLKLLTAMHQELSGFSKSLDKLSDQMNSIRSITQEGNNQYQQLVERLRSCQDTVNSDLTRLDSQLGVLITQTQALNG